MRRIDLSYKSRFLYLFVMLFVFAGLFGLAENTFAQSESGESRKANGDEQIPKDWARIADEKKGYSFYVPQDSVVNVKQVPGLDIFSLTTAPPSSVDLILLSYNDKTKTKEDLLDDAVSYLESLELKVTPGTLKGESDNYAVADVTTEHPQKGTGKFRILVATDVTDNYVLMIGCQEEAFAKNEKIIDTIWGSFEMWSGKH